MWRGFRRVGFRSAAADTALARSKFPLRFIAERQNPVVDRSGSQRLRAPPVRAMYATGKWTSDVLIMRQSHFLTAAESDRTAKRRRPG